MSFYMATTQIASEKTAMEISKLLAMAGAKQTLTSYSDDGEAEGLSFTIERNNVKIPFKLPVNWRAVMIAMQNDKKTSRSLCNKNQASRVAWRLILRWVQAQLALVEAGAVKIEEVFLPYAQQSNGQTIYQSFVEKKFLALAAHE